MVHATVLVLPWFTAQPLNLPLPTYSQVVRLLNDLYTEFDTLTDKHGVYKGEGAAKRKGVRRLFNSVGGRGSRCDNGVVLGKAVS